MTSGVFGQLKPSEGSVTTTIWGSGSPAVVFLHDGLGSIAQWRALPSRVASLTGLAVLAYDRPGHGTSTPVPTGSWSADWMSQQAELLDEVIAETCATPPVVVGHSDGGSIAMLQAAAGESAVAGVVSLAAHSYVEQKCVAAISAMRSNPGPIVTGLSHYHAKPEALFSAWSGAWVSDEFRSWDIRLRLASIESPVLVVQGAADEYATDEMASSTAASVGSDTPWLLVPGAGHLLHHTHSDELAELIVGRTSKWLG